LIENNDRLTPSHRDREWSGMRTNANERACFGRSVWIVRIQIQRCIDEYIFRKILQTCICIF